MKQDLFLLSLVFVIGGMLTGCAAKQESLVDNFRGTAFHLQKYNQIVAVEQEPSQVPPAGLDGHAAVIVHKRYVDGFNKPERPGYTIKGK